MGGHGCGEREQEDQANELGGELLLPTSAAHRLARRGASDEQVATHYGISIEMARWRLNATGARLIADRGRKAYQRR
jgi:Zn-dependent peptidase ImmA (M78 family)